MDSAPPAMMISAPPARMRSAAMAIACSPEQQNRLMVTRGNQVRQAGPQRDDARHVHSRFGFRHGAAQDDIVDFVLRDLRVALQ